MKAKLDLAPNKKNGLSISTEMAYIRQVKLIGDRSTLFYQNEPIISLISQHRLACRAVFIILGKIPCVYYMSLSLYIQSIY